MNFPLKGMKQHTYYEAYCEPLPDKEQSTKDDLNACKYCGGRCLPMSACCWAGRPSPRPRGVAESGECVAGAGELLLSVLIVHDILIIYFIESNLFLFVYAIFTGI
jgi:hypothetical protein